MDIFDNLPAFLSVNKIKHMPLLPCSSSLFVDLAQNQPRKTYWRLFQMKTCSTYIANHKMWRHSTKLSWIFIRSSKKVRVRTKLKKGKNHCQHASCTTVLFSCVFIFAANSFSISLNTVHLVFNEYENVSSFLMHGMLLKT
jgi:hypothetical protein